MQLVQFQQARCRKSCPMVKELAILLMTPTFEPLVDNVDSPITFTIFFCHQRDVAEHYLCSCPINHLIQWPKVPFNFPDTPLFNLVTAILEYQQWVIIRGLNQARKSLSDIPYPGPREAADLTVGWVRSTYGALCSPQKGVTHYDYSSFIFDVRGGDLSNR
ncbi:hypothetical protein HGM15179_018623 [Zosterops borbonicus]|uniref:Uncharacterized protein n=1 Tax=Zosterops borbonicus TaxID=364589 RepID=A0A8K1DC80_9PASS|nr:hypothetical protein HGM15179_018623 [Zosterops borbonicus]